MGTPVLGTENEFTRRERHETVLGGAVALALCNRGTAML